MEFEKLNGGVIKKGKNIPNIPLKTYRWEDVRRSRRKGGYPWTYLYKEAYCEDIDPQPYTMEAIRRSKSSSTMGKTDGVEILELSSSAKSSTTALEGNLGQIVTEPNEDDVECEKKCSDGKGSVQIEECGDPEPELASAASSDNISQYLDKDDPLPGKSESKKLEDTDQQNTDADDRAKRAKSEDTQQRKRKLSAESSYSRMSLSKLGMMKKLKDVKSKIKPSKFTFSASKLKIPIPKKSDKTPTNDESNPKKQTKKKSIDLSFKKSKEPETPVYIHIPLKSTEDETEKMEDSTESPTDKKITDEPITDEQPSKIEEQEPKKPIDKPPELRTSRKGPLKINPAFKQLLKDVKQLGEVEKQETEVPKQSPIVIIPMEVIEPDIKPAEPMEIDTADNEEMIIDTDEAQDISELKFQKSSPVIKPDTEEIQEEDKDEFDDLFNKASSSKPEKILIVSQTDEQRKVRSKSAEPERKRKLSIDSSYSRKSTSKLSIMKKLKDATEKVKGAFSLSNLHKKEPPKKEEKRERKRSKAADIIKPVQKIDLSTIKPVYIHIPLKPPPGESDEFSYLEFEEKPAPQDASATSPKESPTPQSSPGSPQTNVQFIFLTPPSDDETLNDKTPDIPETPSTENTVFFGGKIDELKQLAQKAVDDVSPESVRKKLLETVCEESSSEKSLRIEECVKKEDSEPKIVDVQLKEKPKEEVKMTVDIEDGLSESKAKPEELKSSLKTETDSPPLIKKKVSFKRRSKTPKDSEYEEISPPKEEVAFESKKVEDEVLVVKKEEDTKEKDKSLLMESQSISMSADEEKIYLDQKIIKDTSLEEDYNKWSKESDHDHEYEPINPPPEEEEEVPPPQTVSLLPSGEISNINDTTTTKLTPLTTQTVVIQSPPQENKRKESFAKRIFHFHHSEEEDDEESVPKTPSGSEETAKKPEGSHKIQEAFKQKTDQIKNKFQNMKKPNLTLPPRPKFKKPDFKKFKIEKPKFNLPKIPDTFTLPKRSVTTTSSVTTTTTRPSLKERNLSTESNDGDSKKPLFDFSTYPRLFKKKPKQASQSDAYATTPRQKKTTESSEASSIRIPLHSEDSMDLDNGKNSEEFEREDSVERRMIAEEEASRIRYKDIDIDDEYARENQEINRAERWQHGNFNPHQETLEERFRKEEEDFEEHFRNSQYKVTDLDSPEDENRNFTTASQQRKNGYSSEGSTRNASPRPGVLEEIDSDQFIVREKGLSQDNIEIGQWISSEIREAFRTPTNALSEIRGSNQSLPMDNKRKPVKKPKRKKTPHVSQEKIPYYDDEESLEDIHADLPPSRPKRRSKRLRKPPSDQPSIVPYQETIAIDDDREDFNGNRLHYQRDSLGGILGDDEREDMDFQMYENERMAGKEQPEIQVTDPYRNLEFMEAERRGMKPTAPPRRHRSLRSLTLSENDSNAGYNLGYDQDEINNEINRATEEELRKYIIPTTAQEEPPKRPSRSRSHASSISRGTSLKESESLQGFTESYTSENQENQMPCVEEPCVQDVRDYMGYAVVDKNKQREPPLPPPRASIRRKKRSAIDEEMKFSTVPRTGSGNKDIGLPPVRPLRNYSTLQQVKTQKQNVLDPVVYQNKENIDIIQYIEIDDDVNRDLQRGDVIEKMKQRPLPAPPRPPRKSKSTRPSLQDITNIITDDNTLDKEDSKFVQEETVSTQTEPLPEGFVCEELVQEPSDDVIEGSRRARTDDDAVIVEKRLITPTHYTYEETVTHGSLVVEPLNGAKLLPDSQLSSRERIVPVETVDSDEETSVIPEDFKKLKNPITPRVVESEVIKAQKLQISDLDVDRLTVNQLLANKIVVSEIESSSIQANEIQSKSGDIKINEISLPPEFVQEIVKSLTSQKPEQKKTPTDQLIDTALSKQEEPPVPPPRIQSQPIETFEPPTLSPQPQTTQQQRLESPIETHERSLTPPPTYDEPIERPATPSSTLSEPIESAEALHDTPTRPPRQTTTSKQKIDKMLEPDVDDEPPPRPPEPELSEYFPSQPPASFYALRAAQFVENLDRDEHNIPVVPRRRRQKRAISRSHSTSEEDGYARRNRHSFRRHSESSIPELTGRLMEAVRERVTNTIKRLIKHVSNNVLGNVDGNQDMHVFIVILLVLIAGLILLGGGGKTVVHMHHWEYFNPPRDL